MPNARAVRIREAGGPEVLTLGEIEVRDPGPGEILVDVAAAGLNRADTLQRRGFYPAPPGAPADVPGLEYAGTVAATGDGVSAWKVGDRVMGIVAGGGMATCVVVHEREAIVVPDGMDLVEAAAVPEVFLTAYDAVFLQAELALGEIVLVHAIASGVGTALLQLARHAGATVVGTTRSEAKLARCRELGLEHEIVVSDGKFADALAERTGGRLADVVLDTVGAAYLGENFAATAACGRIVVIGLMGGVTGEAPLGLLLRKRLRVRGTVLRARPLEEKATLAQRFSKDIAPLFASGALAPVIDEVLPMDRVADAHRRMEENRTVGKLVLRW